MSKIFPPTEDHILEFLANENIVDQVEEFIERLQDKYLEEHCDDSYDLVQYDSILNTIARVIENIAIDNQ